MKVEALRTALRAALLLVTSFSKGRGEQVGFRRRALALPSGGGGGEEGAGAAEGPFGGLWRWVRGARGKLGGARQQGPGSRAEPAAEARGDDGGRGGDAWAEQRQAVPSSSAAAAAEAGRAAGEGRAAAEGGMGTAEAGARFPLAVPFRASAAREWSGLLAGDDAVLLPV